MTVLTDPTLFISKSQLTQCQGLDQGCLKAKASTVIITCTWQLMQAAGMVNTTHE